MNARRRVALAIALGFLTAVAVPAGAPASEPAWWTALKLRCNLPSNTAYNDWTSQGMPCRPTSAAAPAAPLDDPALRARLQADADDEAARRRREADIAAGAIPAIPDVPDGLPAPLQEALADRRASLVSRKTAVGGDQANAQQQCANLEQDADRYRTCTALVASQLSGEVQNLDVDIEQFANDVHAAATTPGVRVVALPPTPAPIRMTAAWAKHIAAERAELAALEDRYARLDHVYQMILRESDAQRDNEREHDALRDEVTQDLVSDSLGGLQSKYFLGALKTRLHLTRHDVEELKALFGQLRDAADAYAAYEAAKSASAHPHDDAALDRLREKALTLMNAVTVRAAGLALPHAVKEDVERLINLEFELVKGATAPPTEGPVLTQVASALDQIAAMAGAVDPEFGALRSAGNALDGFVAFAYVQHDAAAIDAAGFSLARARDSLQRDLFRLEDREAAVRLRIDLDVSQGAP